jgi:hypothetical protein
MTHANQHSLNIGSGGMPDPAGVLDDVELSLVRGARYARDKEALTRALLDEAGDVALCMFKAAVAVAEGRGDLGEDPTQGRSCPGSGQLTSRFAGDLWLSLDAHTSSDARGTLPRGVMARSLLSWLGTGVHWRDVLVSWAGKVRRRVTDAYDTRLSRRHVFTPLPGDCLNSQPRPLGGVSGRMSPGELVRVALSEQNYMYLVVVRQPDTRSERWLALCGALKRLSVWNTTALPGVHSSGSSSLRKAHIAIDAFGRLAHAPSTGAWLIECLRPTDSGVLSSKGDCDRLFALICNVRDPLRAGAPSVVFGGADSLAGRVGDIDVLFEPVDIGQPSDDGFVVMPSSDKDGKPILCLIGCEAGSSDTTGHASMYRSGSLWKYIVDADGSIVVSSSQSPGASIAASTQMGLRLTKR